MEHSAGLRCSTTGHEGTDLSIVYDAGCFNRAVTELYPKDDSAPQKDTFQNIVLLVLFLWP